MEIKPKIVIAGGNGFFGKHLIEYFRKTKKVIVLTRGKAKVVNEVEYVNWDGKTIGGWTSSLNSAEALINLSGKSINCRFTEGNKKVLLSSRIDSTKVLAEAIQKLDNPPKIWLNASAGAMYQTGDVPNTEEDKVFKNDFLAHMALEWEKAFYKDELAHTKRAATRISLILGNDGGVFPVWRKVTQLFLGGKVGSGNQKVSWIHVNDAVKAIEFIIEKNIEGPVNFSTNKPVKNKKIMKTLRTKMNVPFGFPAPKFGVKLGGFILQTEPSLLLDDVNFIPKKLIDNGFVFEFGILEEAIENLLDE